MILLPALVGVAAALAAPNVVDRTIQCTPGAAHGSLSVTVSAQTGWKKNETFEWPGQFAVATPGQPLPRRRNYMPQLLGVTTGYPLSPPVDVGGLGYNAKLCKTVHVPVALTNRRLTGGEAGLFGNDQYTCLLSGPVVIRFRATFFDPAALKPVDRQRTWYGARGRIQRVQVAVRTLGGKRLAYGEALDSGKARIFTSRGCT